MSKPMISKSTVSVTFSLESEDGRMPCDSPDGQTIKPSGPALVPANRSAAQEKMKDFSTRGTCGPLFEGLSPSAILQSSLENRLRARLGVHGSPECEVIWKEWDMPSGAPICALRASARRTSAKGFTGWPTPQAHDVTGRSDHQKEIHGTKHGCSCLVQTAKLTGWATPTVQDAKNNAGPSQHKGRRHSNPPNVEAT